MWLLAACSSIFWNVAGDDAVASPANSQEMLALRNELAALRAELKAQGEKNSREMKAMDERTRRLSSEGNASNSAWLILCGALVMFMHAGFAMLETGSCRAKNASNVLMKNLINVCVGTLGWWIFGYAFAYGTGIADDDDDDGNGFIGHSGFFSSGFFKSNNEGQINPLPDGANAPLSWFFQWAFCTAAATIVSGGVAERVKSPTFGVFAFCMTSFIYPPVVAWTWGYGWLSTLFDVGYMDFAGSGIVHLTGGVAALMGTIVLRPRKGRFEPLTRDEFVPHNLPLVVLGTFSLWFGWYGFNPGSTLGMDDTVGYLAAHVAMNTTLSAAMGGITVFIVKYFLNGRYYDVGGLCNGILGGLVSITAGCSNMDAGFAVLTGFIGAFVYAGSSQLLVMMKIDDPVDASPVHGACGIWGVLAAALFDWGKSVNHFNGWNNFGCVVDEDNGGCMDGAWAKALGANVILVVMVILWSGGLSGIAFFVLNALKVLRITEETELTGLDEKQHSPPKAYSITTAKASEATV